MLGIGETIDELFDVLADLRAIRCDVLTLGQYLAPTLKQHPGRAVRAAGGVRRHRGEGAADGLPAGGRRAVRAVQLPRRRDGAAVKRSPRSPIALPDLGAERVTFSLWYVRARRPRLRGRPRRRGAHPRRDVRRARAGERRARRAAGAAERPAGRRAGARGDSERGLTTEDTENTDGRTRRPQFVRSLISCSVFSCLCASVVSPADSRQCRSLCSSRSTVSTAPGNRPSAGCSSSGSRRRRCR